MERSFARWTAGAALFALAAGCGFTTQVPAGRDIPCGSATDACPTGYVCRPALGRCVDVSLLQDTAAGVTSLQLQPTLGTVQTTFTLTFEVTGALAEAPHAYASAVHLQGNVETYPFTCNFCSPTEPCTCTFTPDPQNLPPAGTLEVQVEIVDGLGNTPPPFAAPSLQLDFTPPTVVPPASLTLSPPAGVTTPLRALGPGVGAELCFRVDKALGPLPTVWAESTVAPDAGALNFSIEDGYPVELSYCYQATMPLAPLFPDGPLQAWALATDLAGNQAQLALPLEAVPGAPALTADYTPPAAPDVSLATGLHYHRAPWGEQPTIGSPYFALTSTGSPIPKAGTLVATADAAQQFELGRWAVAPGPLPALPLLTPEQPVVWVNLVDQAGNSQVGGPVLVRNVDWVVNLGLKVAGDLEANPHDCYAKTVFGPSLVSPDDTATELSAATGPTGRDGGLQLLGGASWRERSVVVPDLSSDTLTYNPTQGLVMMLDGEGTSVTFNGHDWSFPTQNVVPASRGEYGLAYDRNRGRMVMFGGYDNTSTGNTLCDTWELGPSGWVQAQDCALLADGGLDPTLPSPRLLPCLGYDPDRQQTVLVSGVTPSGAILPETWTWSGQTWTQLSEADAGASFSCILNTLAYLDTPDAGSGLVMLSEPDPSGTTGSATWFGQWDGQAYRWTMAVPPLPATLTAQSLAIDPATGRAMAAFIDMSTATPTAELWTWDGTPGSTWQLLGAPPVSWLDGILYLLAPYPASPGGGPSMTLLQSGGGYPDEAFVCSTAPLDCTLLHTNSTGYSFPYSVANGLAFDSSGHGVFASSDPQIDNGSLTQAWNWSGSDDWQFGPSGPSARAGGALGYLPPSDTFLYFGGLFFDGGQADDLWSYAPDAGWLEVSPSTPGATPRCYDNLVFIPDAGLDDGLVAIGSGGPAILLSPQADGGFVATPLSATAPLGSFAYDPIRGRAVVAAQVGLNLYEASPPSFDFAVVDHGPDVPVFASLIGDGTGGGLLVVGGGRIYGSSVEGAIDRWDGTHLQPLTVVDAESDGNPITDFLPVVAYDSVTQRVMVVDTNVDHSANRTWELSLGSAKPAVECQFRLAAAGAPAGTTFTHLQVTATGGVQGADGGAAAVLLLWDQGEWTPVETCAAPGCTIAAPGPLQFESADPVAIARLFRDRGTLGVAVSPANANGPAVSQLAVGVVQATLSYQLP